MADLININFTGQSVTVLSSIQISKDVSISSTDGQQRAQGSATLSTKMTNERSRLDRLHQQGCAKLRVPTGHASGLEAVMINSSGGMTGGDRLNWTFHAGAKTDLTITTQACERVYRSASGTADTQIDLTIGANARLNWLPQETILFDGGSYARTLNAELHRDSELLLCEPVVFGRRAMGELVRQGKLQDSWRIHQNGKLIHAEECHLDGPINDILNRPFCLNGATAMATIVLVSRDIDAKLDGVRRLIGNQGDCSAWNGRLLARLVGENSYELRKTLQPLIALLNDGKNLPKVWAT